MGFFTATLTPEDLEKLVTLFELRHYRIIKCIYNRPNIFYDVLEISHSRELSEVTDFVVNLVNPCAESPEEHNRLLVYANKDIATRLTVLLGLAFGQYEGKCGGQLRADLYMTSASRERKQDIICRFMDSYSLDVLCATNALGMGIDMKNLYHILDVGFCTKLSQWAQESGRAGRDGLPSIAYITRGIPNMNMEASMREFVSSDKFCKRLAIAREFDPDVDPKIKFDMQPGDDDRTKAATCCYVCKQRGSMHDAEDRVCNVRTVKLFTCPSGCSSKSRGAGKFCSNCGTKQVVLISNEQKN